MMFLCFWNFIFRKVPFQNEENVSVLATATWRWGQVYADLCPGPQGPAIIQPLSPNESPLGTTVSKRHGNHHVWCLDPHPQWWTTICDAEIPWIFHLALLSYWSLAHRVHGGIRLKLCSNSGSIYGPSTPIKLVGGLEHFLNFPHIGNVIIPTDFHSIIFQRGRYTSTTNQNYY